MNPFPTDGCPESAQSIISVISDDMGNFLVSYSVHGQPPLVLHNCKNHHRAFEHTKYLAVQVSRLDICTPGT